MVRRLLRSPLLWIGFAVVAANALYLFGILDPNPMIIHGNIYEHVGGKLVPGADNVDANAGFTSQALAHRAMEDWFGGHVPWWDPFEGMGAPLAGGMQSAAFFPFAVLLLLADGQVYMYCVLSLIAAYSTYFLALRLEFAPRIAAVAGICFGLSGAFAVLRFAPENPVCFLPLILLGAEIARARAIAGRGTQWWIIAVALALSIVAGFPETAYLDLLFAIVWVLVRCRGLAGHALRRYLRGSLAGGITGLLLGGPFLAAVVAYIPHAYLSQNVDSSRTVEPFSGIVTLFFPYAYGQLWSHTGNGTIAGAWSEFGGYLTVALLLLAVMGLLGRRHRALRIALACWSVLIVATGYGVPVIAPLIHLIPGMSYVVVPRFMAATLSFAVVILAVFGIEDLLAASGSVTSGAALSRRRVSSVIALVTVVAAAAAIDASVIFRRSSDSLTIFVAIAWGTVTVVLIAFAALALLPRAVGVRTGLVRRVATVILIGLLPLEAVVMFVVPELSAPRSGTLDGAVLSFLDEHLGDQRFATLGPLLPNYGAYFGLAAINVNDNPEPQAFAHLILTDLQPSALPATFTGTVKSSNSGIDPATALITYMSNYEALGVKYVLATTGQHTKLGAPKSDRGAALRTVYDDALVTIYELPKAAPFFAAGPGCALRPAGLGRVHASCTAAATLIRNEIAFPGWSAQVDGRPVELGATTLHQQTVRLPAGNSTVSFSYRPKYATAGWIALVIGTLLCLASLTGGGRSFRRGDS